MSDFPPTVKLRFIEVKGRIKGLTTGAITKNEIPTVLSPPNDFIKAIAIIDSDEVDLRYVWRRFQREPDFLSASLNDELDVILIHVRSADDDQETA